MNPTNCAAAVLYRLTMCSLGVVLWVISTLDARSLMAQFATHDYGSFLCAATGILGLIGMVDVLINDVLNEKFNWRPAYRHRHLILVGLAFCYIAQVYIGSTSFKSLGLNLFASWNAVSLLSLAFIDAAQRSKEMISHARNLRPA